MTAMRMRAAEQEFRGFNAASAVPFTEPSITLLAAPSRLLETPTATLWAHKLDRLDINLRLLPAGYHRATLSARSVKAEPWREMQLIHTPRGGKGARGHSLSGRSPEIKVDMAATRGEAEECRALTANESEARNLPGSRGIDHLRANRCVSLY